MSLTRDELSELLRQYGIMEFGEMRMVDSSHGEADIRHNYILDNQYVLRVNSVNVMNERRIGELNTLIRRYRAFGLQAPLFLAAVSGNFVVEYGGKYCYLSEYLDYPLADDVKDSCREELIRERLVLVATFAQKYRNVDLTDTVSMYSIFDLSPYDQLTGIDEKQDNFQNLVQDLNAVGERALAEKLTAQYRSIREKLLPIYRTLPRCVFQGDENFSNLCVDKEKHIIGLFDFNMSGTEVIANYLANIAFQGNFYYTEEMMQAHTAEEIFARMMHSYEESTAEICRYYPFTQRELYAYGLYSRIVMISGYVNQAAFSEFLRDERYREKTIRLLRFISHQLGSSGEYTVSHVK